MRKETKALCMPYCCSIHVSVQLTKQPWAFANLWRAEDGPTDGLFVTLKLPLKIRSNCKCTHMHAHTFSDWWLVMGVFLSSEWGEEGSQREERLTAPLGPLKSSCLQKWWKVKDEICVCVCTHVRLVWCFGLISKSLQPTLILKLIHMQNICLRWWDREDPRSRPDEFRHTHTHTHTHT